MTVVKRAQVDAQFPLPTETTGSVDVGNLEWETLTDYYITRGEM